ncbi:MAG: ABC transporter ATP-binding protein [Candidatus Viridilinea halotolerans]|uniref:ABC transporter ATP-binding protein n=1 Tax=Candidatus Viridilinea halotolerans TaxID=2491704 RepID=A0A426TRI1_9CHLR|nr:MAG: ABC transporter ATP-binding protein [Candidatus Viridilinea halotolerans]
MSALEARAVSKLYRAHDVEVLAVDALTLSVEAGEFVALIGPSGSGKTTMLALLAGLLLPDSGEVVIEGRSLNSLGKAGLAAFRLKQIGFTFQAHNLVPYLTVRENVELMLRLNGRLDRQGRARATELLTQLGLERRLNNLPSELSGGQQQRVAIARALVHEPSIVLADEPTASLDSERAHQVTAILAQLIHAQGRAGIMVTHDPRMCIYADRIVRLEDGRVTRVLTTREEIALFAQTG